MTEQLELSFNVNLDAFEGPIDLLLHLARQQKVDLTQISILALAEQYLVLIADLRLRDLQVAADYLVMAAWLAYLKSRLLLPREEQPDDELSPQDLEQALAQRLKLLQAMQKAGRDLMELPQYGVDVFGRPEIAEEDKYQIVENIVYKTDLYDVLRAYARIHRKSQTHEFRIPPSAIFSVEQGIARLRRLLGEKMVPDWTVLESFLPGIMKNPLARRSAIASLFVASLDLAKSGVLKINQERLFGPIYLKSAPVEQAGNQGEA